MYANKSEKLLTYRSEILEKKTVNAMSYRWLDPIVSMYT